MQTHSDIFFLRPFSGDAWSMLFHGCLRPQEIETLWPGGQGKPRPLGEGVAGFRLPRLSKGTGAAETVRGRSVFRIEWAAQPVAYKKTAY